MKFIATLFLFWGTCQGLQAQVSMKKNNVRVKDVLVETSKQANLDYTHESKLLWDAEKVSIDVTNAPAEQVADICSKDQFFTVTVKGSTLVVQRRMIYVRGRCINQEFEPMPGVIIAVAGTDCITTTDADGYFTLANVDANALLVIRAMNIITDSM